MTSGQHRKSVELIQSIHGPLFSYENDLISGQLHRNGAHTRNELAMLLSFVKDAALIVDVGSHIGSYAIPLAQKGGPSSCIIALEASSKPFELLRRNIDANQLAGQITPINKIVSDTPENFVVYHSETNTGATYFKASSTGRHCNTCTVDAMVSKHAPGRTVDMIKIDVEGMELAVLRSARQTIGSYSPILYIEVVQDQLARFGKCPKDIEAFLQDHGYRFYRNIGPRNSSHDRYEIARLACLRDGGDFFDCLAIPYERIDQFSQLRNTRFYTADN